MIAALLVTAAATAAAAPAPAPEPVARSVGGATLGGGLGGFDALTRPLVSSIVVELSGRRSTSSESILRLMNTQEGAPYDALRLENDLVRLRATGVLYDVSAQTSEGEAGKQLTVKATDRWSLLPVFGLRRGGGRTTARVGITDRNVLGRLLQLHGEVTSSSDIPFSSIHRIGSYLWAAAPRIGGSRFSAGLFWQREFLDFAGWDAAGAPSLSYDRNRHLMRGELRYEIRDLFTVALTSAVANDSYVRNDLGPAYDGPLPRSGRTATVGAELTLGLCDDRVASMRGTEMKLSVDVARAGMVSDFSFVSATAQFRSFFVPREGHNVGVQLVAQGTTARDDSHLFRAGGLWEIRGFPDSYFLGQRLVRGNVEYRKELVRTSFVLPTVIQAAAFVDGGHISGRADAVGGARYEGPMASAGGGLRFIIVPFARAVARVDVAAGLYPRNTIDVSLGGQHFF